MAHKTKEIEKKKKRKTLQLSPPQAVQQEGHSFPHKAQNTKHQYQCSRTFTKQTEFFVENSWTKESRAAK
jgi:hypothetical protein